MDGVWRKGGRGLGEGGGVGSNGFDPGQPAGQKPVEPSRSGCGEAVHAPGYVDPETLSRTARGLGWDVVVCCCP